MAHHPARVTTGNPGLRSRGGTGEVQVTLAHLDPIERATITGYHWWSREELAATTEAFFPAELPELLRLAGDAS
jgi:hypothetical protein